MKPRLLYLSPVTPSPTGNGLAMRAYHNLLALSSRYAVSLLIIPTGWRSKKPSSELLLLCERITLLAVHPLKDSPLVMNLVRRKLWPEAQTGRNFQPYELRSFCRRRLHSAAALFKTDRFDVIHLFRLYLYPYAFCLHRMNDRALLQLDLDDLESLTRKNQSDLLQRTGYLKRARWQAKEAAAYQRIEQAGLPRFNRIFTCSELDRERLSTMYGHLPVEIVPNVVTLIRAVKQGIPAVTFVFLFVGSFSYFPNADGLAFLVKQLLPLLHRTLPGRFCVKVVGAGVPWRTRIRFLLNRRLTFLGPIQDLKPCYREAGAALVPIRVGGGTRIKAIEAAAHHLAIVSTSKGIEGLAFKPGVDVLVGDTAAEFAEQCRALMTQADLRQRLSASAFSVFQQFYTLGQVHRVLAG